MVKLNKIYTRTGDDGSTGLVDGSRVAKSDARMVAIGEVDESNSVLGFAIATLAVEARTSDSLHLANLVRIQNDLFDLGADIATPAKNGEDFTPDAMTLRIVASQVDALEQMIDDANADLPPLRSFILPGGSTAAAAMHMARATSRRAERALVLVSDSVAINPHALRYLNRLSDYLFVLCRVIAAERGGDMLWVPGASR